MIAAVTQVQRGDHSTIALAGQMGQQAVKKGSTDTVTISQKAVQMVSNSKQSNSQASITEKPVPPGRSAK